MTLASDQTVMSLSDTWQKLTEEKYEITSSPPDAAILVQTATEPKLTLKITLTSPAMREEEEDEEEEEEDDVEQEVEEGEEEEGEQEEEEEQEKKNGPGRNEKIGRHKMQLKALFSMNTFTSKIKYCNNFLLVYMLIHSLRSLLCFIFITLNLIQFPSQHLLLIVQSCDLNFITYIFWNSVALICHVKWVHKGLDLVL